MSGSCNMASWSPQERKAMQADLLACRIRHQLGSLKGAERQKAGQQLLAQIAPHLQQAVVERLKARSST